MTESFKRKLQAYQNGTLPGEERAELEAELEKLEAYQAYLDELMEDDSEPDRLADRAEEDGSGSRETAEGRKSGFGENERLRRKKERRIIRRAKWKSRGITALVTLIVLGLVFGGSGLFTHYYYTQREVGPTAQALREVNEQALGLIVETTMPNRYLMPNGGDPGLLFDLTISGRVQHVWGSEGVSEKEIRQDYRFGRIRDTRITSLNGASDLYSKRFATADEGRLWLPGGSDRKQEEARNAGVWQTLSDLPKLTVSELYVSLDREYGQQELDRKFWGLRVAPRWFAARSGQEWAGLDSYTVMDAEGNTKPAQPEDYLNLYVHNPVGANGGMGASYIPVRSETNGEYLKHGALSWKSGLVEALRRVAQSPEVAASVSPVDFASAAAEVEANGSKVYGVVVTGRSEELAKLQNEPWMKGAIVRLGDSALDTAQLDPYKSYR
ncbi:MULTISPECIES: anti sigma factor C-terminal domain-containing protein [Saccharibacillus]|uniref:anti sigma factor C-terminal domain-containing protein n=1 Tax=Saccharibacillus TaxID=456492 RepID=UPI00123AE0B0|nr:hypothetical protein [Saccharibacillus sp. WB 17]